MDALPRSRRGVRDRAARARALSSSSRSSIRATASSVSDRGDLGECAAERVEQLLAHTVVHIGEHSPSADRREEAASARRSPLRPARTHLRCLQVERSTAPAFASSCGIPTTIDHIATNRGAGRSSLVEPRLRRKGPSRRRFRGRCRSSRPSGSALPAGLLGRGACPVDTPP